MSLIAKIFAGKNPLDGITNLVDEVFTSKEEKAAAARELMALENEINSKLIDQEKEIINAQSRIIEAEATGSWIQRNWRPLLMLVFTYIIFHNYVLVPIFSIPAADLDQNIWDLLKIGIGGYIVTRGGEKMVANFTKRK